MKTNIILFALIATSNWVISAASLPTLLQPRYFVNGTVEWFPQIIGGSTVEITDTISEVSIQNRYGYHLCSGTLISLLSVATATNCLLKQNSEFLDPSEIRVIADETDINGEGSARRQLRDVETYYIRATSGIAVLELFDPLNVTSTLKYRKIYNGVVRGGQDCHIAGWGVSPPSKLNIRLQKVQLKIQTNPLDNSKYIENQLPRGTFAAITTLPACFGDLGSAVICDKFIVGILSFGYGCERPDFPLVFHQTYDDEVIRNSNRRGGGSGGSSSGNNGGSNGGSGGSNSGGGSIGGTTLFPGGGSNGGSNGGSTGTTRLPGSGSVGGNNNNGIIVFPPGAGNPGHDTECIDEKDADCGGTVIKLSISVLLFPIIQYCFTKLVIEF